MGIYKNYVIFYLIFISIPYELFLFFIIYNLVVLVCGNYIIILNNKFDFILFNI